MRNQWKSTMKRLIIGILSASALLFSMPVFAQEVVDITISPDEAEVVVGKKVKFKAEAYDATGKKVKNPTIVWFVEGGIGVINDNDKKNAQFTATTEGIGSVVASVGAISAQATVTVTSEHGTG